METSQTPPVATMPEEKPLSEAKISVPQHVVYRTFVSETVLLNLQSGVYHGLNPTAGRMLELLEKTGSFDETVKQLVAEYERSQAEITEDLSGFCRELLQHGLIELA